MKKPIWIAKDKRITEFYSKQPLLFVGRKPFLNSFGFWQQSHTMWSRHIIPSLGLGLKPGELMRVEIKEAR